LTDFGVLLGTLVFGVWNLGVFVLGVSEGVANISGVSATGVENPGVFAGVFFATDSGVPEVVLSRIESFGVFTVGVKPFSGVPTIGVLDPPGVLALGVSILALGVVAFGVFTFGVADFSGLLALGVSFAGVLALGVAAFTGVLALGVVVFTGVSLVVVTLTGVFLGVGVPILIFLLD